MDESNLKDINILLVEDNPVNQKLTATVLNKAGFSVDIAGNGLIAVELLEKKLYDLVLMDINMPVMNGYEAARAIRSREEWGDNIIIIAMTAYGEQESRGRSIEAGMNDYIAKPIEVKDVISKIKKWLSSS